MNRPRFASALLLLLSFACGAYAQNRFYLPQVANGDYGDGSFRMTFILFNKSDIDTSALLELTGDTGQPLNLTIDGSGTGSQFPIPLPAGATRILQTDGTGDLVVGPPQ